MRGTHTVVQLVTHPMAEDWLYKPGVLGLTTGLLTFLCFYLVFYTQPGYESILFNHKYITERGVAYSERSEAIPAFN